jgi:hypothetical protein
MYGHWEMHDITTHEAHRRPSFIWLDFVQRSVFFALRTAEPGKDTTETLPSRGTGFVIVRKCSCADYLFIGFLSSLTLLIVIAGCPASDLIYLQLQSKMAKPW